MKPSPLRQISIATGLPHPLIQNELEQLVLAAGADPELATIEDLREILASYLQDVLLEAKDVFGQTSASAS